MARNILGLDFFGEDQVPTARKSRGRVTVIQPHTDGTIEVSSVSESYVPEDIASYGRPVTAVERSALAEFIATFFGTSKW